MKRGKHIDHANVPIAGGGRGGTFRSLDVPCSSHFTPNRSSQPIPLR